jgi:hypothetical protein
MMFGTFFSDWMVLVVEMRRALDLIACRQMGMIPHYVLVKRLPDWFK